ncbi:Mte1p CYBJADRAFT_47233 [Cyberlindnera jadinii NRRL Y-1542]|uniref:5'-3' DNA helicase ZGRF1-like N-terminal domain-containing protein n=1 Tax=Cyberlindnera jadinii (strain ATCC 18201 / CBS 1600 / BCRC 20928 / JCM 3617 / NBRC 0987 / NRRL Y-1542) TaxID=983966 RepID=A0A1E4S7D1_CYBJN|nr:hypothetical protein CYBJADRAFT_47233 [Cyberlindnera jadinii NRRL Y-1542]ODV75415.1 hypothetical protein CYBJADRAFT_47233 [Cyberlindnera jadinii NRRL Y-1542]
MSQAIESRILEYNVLFTHDVRKKLKKWIDGKLRHYKLNDKVQVLSEDGIVVTEQFMLKADFSDQSKWDDFIKVGGVLVQIDSILCEFKRNVVPSKNIDQNGNSVGVLKITKAEALNVARGKSQSHNSPVSMSDMASDSQTLTPTLAASRVRRRVGLSRLHTPSKRRTGIKPTQITSLSQISPRGSDTHSIIGSGKSKPSSGTTAPRLQDQAKSTNSSHSSVLSVGDMVPSPATLLNQHHQATPTAEAVSKQVTRKNEEMAMRSLKGIPHATGTAMIANRSRDNLRIAPTSDRWAEIEYDLGEPGYTDCPDSTQTSKISWGTQDPDPSVFASELLKLHKASAACDCENAQSEESGGLSNSSSNNNNNNNNNNKQGCTQKHQELLPRRHVPKPRVGRRGRPETVKISPIPSKSNMK